MPDNEPQLDINNPEGDEFLSDLMADALPGEGDSLNPPADLEADGGPPAAVAEPKPDDKKPEDKVAPEPGTEAASKTEPPAPKTYEYKGKQYTLDQMVELGVLEDVIQTARQFPTIQTKYQSLLEEKAIAPAPGAAAPPQPQGPTGDQILQAYTPIMQKAAEDGYIEPEAYEVFPKLVSSLMFYRDLIHDVRNAVAMMMQTENTRTATTQKESMLNYVGGLCDKVAGEGEHFEILKDAKVRDGFYTYLGTLNIPISQVDEGFIRKQWVAYNAEPVLEAVRLAASGQRAADVKTRRNAKGEGSGVRPAPPKPDSTNQVQEHIDTLIG